LKRIYVSFKRIQLPDTSTPLGMIGRSLALEGDVLDQATQWQMKEAEKELTNHRKVDRALHDEKFTPCKFYYKYFR